MSETENEQKGSLKPESQATPETQENANTLISSRLRGYYNSIVEEGTPDQFLDLLQKLAEVEQASQKKEG